MFAAAICVALVPPGAYVGTPALVGFVALTLIGLTVFEGSAKEQGTDTEETPEA